MGSTGVFNQIRVEVRLAAARNERQSERLRLEKLKSRLREKMGATASEGKNENYTQVLPRS